MDFAATIAHARAALEGREGIVGLLLACMLACAGRAHAEPPHAGQAASGSSAPGLNWLRMPGAEDCLSAAELAERVELRAGRVLFAATTQADLFVDGYVTRTPHGYDVQLQVSKRSGEVLGERKLEIEGEHCEVIDQAVTLVIAVTLYPQSALTMTGIPLDDATTASLQALFGEESTDPEPSALPSPAARAPAEVRREPPGVARRASAQGTSAQSDPASWSLGIDVTAGAGAGELPNVSTLLGAHVQLVAPDLWPVELSVRRWFTNRAELPSAAGTVDFELLAVALSACPWSMLTADLRLCLGAQVGLMTATPRGLAEPAARLREGVVEPTVGLRYRPRLAGPVHLRAALQASVPLIQHSFEFEALNGTQARVFSATPVVGRFELGLGFSF